MSLINNLLRFSVSLRVMLAAFVACIVAFGYYSLSQNDIRAANEERFASSLLTQELRQSSEDLSRMVRTYVTTGERRYREYFDEIVAIRDGLAPRPQEYESIYWDLVLDERRPSSSGPAASLLQRMTEAAFTDEELNRLEVAKRSSDQLVVIEQQAMSLVEAGYDAGTLSPEVRLQAINMMFDARYHRAKSEIMRPIAEVTRMVDARTADAVASAERQAFYGLVVFGLSGSVLLAALWWTMRNLQQVFGGSVSQLRAAVESTENIDTPIATIKGNGDMDSIIGKLMDAHQVRANDDKRSRESERAVSEAERRLRGIVGALDDGVCVVQDALIRFVNPRLQEIFDKPEAELVDHPFIQFVHEDDRAAIMDRYRKRVGGAEIESAVEFRLQTMSGKLRRIVSRGTQFEWAGRPATLYFIKEKE